MIDRRLLLSTLVAAALAPAAAHASGKAETEEASSNPRMDLPTLTTTVRRRDGRRGVLTVQATLYVENAALQQRVALSKPRLMDAYVGALQTWTARLAPGAAPNVDVLTQVLQRETDRVVGKGARVLLGGVMVG